MKRSVSVGRDQLVSLGVGIGKFTHSDKFRLTIGALELLATHAKHKVREVSRPKAPASLPHTTPPPFPLFSFFLFLPQKAASVPS